jgi:hypothetical protein
MGESAEHDMIFSIAIDRANERMRAPRFAFPAR